MKLLIASDHAGFELKGALIPYIQSLGVAVEDMGPHAFDASDDYPDLIAPLARRVSSEEDARGIILGGSGQGEAIVANRFPGVRTALYTGGDMDVVRLSREHNDANVLSLGARFLTLAEAKAAAEIWLSTPFSNDERHVRRLSKLSALPN